jgi:hypothetical protein
MESIGSYPLVESLSSDKDFSNGKAKPNKNGSRMFVQAYALI